MNRRAMILGLALLLLGLALAGPATARAPVRRPPPFLPGTTSVLWVAAHPDDESIAAPLLARLCLDEGLRCSFLVFTRGEKGPCLLRGGCRPDLATVRTAEMIRAAKLFNARLDLWSYVDGGGAADVSAAWDAAAGGHAALLSSLSSIIAATGADLVLTFDPRHGSTCHPDHRAVGNLVVETLAQLPHPPALYFLETRVVPDDVTHGVRFSPAAPASAGVFAFDANVILFSTGSAAWQSLLLDVQAHPSQFDAPFVRALKATSTRERVVFLAPAEMIQGSGELVGSCP
jgi:LmbE family N-acetylglucosaminyl deacetylase